MQLAEQRLRLLQIERVEAFGEPAVDRSEKIAGLCTPALIAPEPRHAHCGAQFPGLGLLLTRNCERTLEVRFRFHRVRRGRLKRDFTRNAIGLGLEPSFLSSFDCADGIVNVTPSVIELSKLRIGQSQM